MGKKAEVKYTGGEREAQQQQRASDIHHLFLQVTTAPHPLLTPSSAAVEAPTCVHQLRRPQRSCQQQHY
jgi:hypothetical protein